MQDFDKYNSRRNGKKNGRQYIDEGYRWKWIMWADDYVYAQGYETSRGKCDQAMDMLGS